MFNKTDFAILLNKAKGDRSINQYANETGVSAAHISRFLREMIDAPPSPETLYKFAIKAYNEVTYHDLMIAAGHLATQNDHHILNQLNSPIQYEDDFVIDQPSMNGRNFDYKKNKFKQILLAYLYDKPIKWSPDNTEKKKSYPDMIINLFDSEYEKWYFDFKPSQNVRYYSPIHFTFIYGSIAMKELNQEDKYTIVVDDEKLFHRILRKPPISLRVNLYIMLINTEKDEVVQEELLCKYLL